MAPDKSDKAPLPTLQTTGQPKKVRGLLGMMEAETKGENWEWDDPSAEYIPGMGLGASKQATRWARIGYQDEIAPAAELAAKRPEHRPPKHTF
jgi:hypothetical protein